MKRGEMMSAQPADQRWNVDEYLVWEREQDTKYELRTVDPYPKDAPNNLKNYSIQIGVQK